MRWYVLLVAALGFWPGQVRADFSAAAQYSDASRGLSMLVMRDGRIVYESYANGGAPTVGSTLASGTKSFSGVIAAAAVQDGLLDLDERVAATLAEWRSDPVRSRITVRQLLQLVSGIDGGSTGRAPSYADAVTRPATETPGSHYSYGPVPFQIFGELMRRKLATAGLDNDVAAYLMRRVAGPVGFSIARWRRGRDGQPLLPQGVFITARDWALFGEFVRLGGSWNGRQLVDRDALESFFVGSPANPAYGLTWWVDDPVARDVLRDIPQLRRAAAGLATDNPVFPTDMIMAAGLGDQRLYISRSEGLVIVRQAQIGRPFRRRFSDVEFWQALRR